MAEANPAAPKQPKIEVAKPPEVGRPEGAETPKAPGTPEQKIVDSIKQGGEPDEVLQDIAGERGTQVMEINSQAFRDLHKFLLNENGLLRIDIPDERLAESIRNRLSEFRSPASSEEIDFLKQDTEEIKAWVLEHGEPTVQGQVHVHKSERDESESRDYRAWASQENGETTISYLKSPKGGNNTDLSFKTTTDQYKLSHWSSSLNVGGNSDLSNMTKAEWLMAKALTQDFKSAVITSPSLSQSA